jgi:Tol biopolymer transport system component
MRKVLVILLIVGSLCIAAALGQQPGAPVPDQVRVQGLAVSPDGKRIALDRMTLGEDPLPRHEMWVVGIRGQQAHCVWAAPRPEGSCRYPTWLRDSRRLVWYAWDGGIHRMDLMVASAEGGRRRWLTNTPDTMELLPVACPTSDWVAYATMLPRATDSDLWAISAGGGEVVHLARPAVRSSSTGVQQAWRSDGTELYFLTRDANGQRTVQGVGFADGRPGAVRTLVTDDRLQMFFVSPDGTRVAYSLPGAAPDVGPLLLTEAGTPTNGRPLAAVAHWWFLAWAPDSVSLCFLRSEDDGSYALCTVDTETMTELQLATGVRGLARQNAWTKDGRIVFTRDGGEIWTVQSDGTGETRVFP